ncbi:MAG: WYL domain-containing protein [Oscillospiraceae bacterium]|nr:WYL domain-containing protein [Oscillospiraceae bacterium]
MSKRGSQKLKLLYLCQYLLRNSDEEHPVTMSDMIACLARQDIAAERKSVYDDLEALRLFGLDVQTVRLGPVTGYFIGQRDFQLPELKLLVDSVQSSRFITEKKSLELIGKLESLASEHEAQALHREVYVRGRIKAMNEPIYYNVDEIHDAIDQDRAIVFQYFEWNVEKKRVLRRNGQRYRVSPWALLWDNENYYMVAYDGEAGKIKHFRVDKMTGIRKTDLPRQGAEDFGRFDMAAYSDSHFGMFSGDVQPVRLAFDRGLAGAVIDRFGPGVSLVPLDETRFSVTVNVAVNVQLFGWLCGFGTQARILAPDSAAAEMGRHAAAIAALYDSAHTTP